MREKKSLQSTRAPLVCLVRGIIRGSRHRESFKFISDLRHAFGLLPVKAFDDVIEIPLFHVPLGASLRHLLSLPFLSSFLSHERYERNRGAITRIIYNNSNKRTNLGYSGGEKGYRLACPNGGYYVGCFSTEDDEKEREREREG